jgi:hypothetical protein
MALSKIDVANMVTGAVPVANGGTALTSGFVNGSDPRPLSKPIIVNGDCAIAQRGNSEASVTTSSISTCDRMALGISSLGTWTVTQETLSSGNAYNAGFKKAYRIDCTTADSSPSSSDNLFMQYKIEGNDVQVFKKGTSSAETYTLAFWVKSNKTGTAQVTLIDADNSRQVGATYSISSADTWEHKVLNYPADTTGAFDNDNAKSLEIEWALDAGSDFTSGAVPSAWESSSNADRSVNDLALGDNTANDWAITGIQLEVGTFSSTTLPPFQFESKEENLRRCARYYQQIGDNPAINGTATGNGHRLSNGIRGGSGSTDFNCLLHLIAPLRATPTTSTTNVNVRQDGNSKALSSIDQIYNHGSHINLECTADSGLSVDNAVQLRFTGGSGAMRLIAEL